MDLKNKVREGESIRRRLRKKSSKFERGSELRGIRTIRGLNLRDEMLKLEEKISVLNLREQGLEEPKKCGLEFMEMRLETDSDVGGEKRSNQF